MMRKVKEMEIKIFPRERFLFTCFRRTNKTKNNEMKNENCKLFPVYFLEEE